MGAGFADEVRFGGAVDAVAGEFQGDPGDADRVAWARRNDEDLVDIVHFGPHAGIERVIGVGCGDGFDRGVARGQVGFVPGNGTLEQGELALVLVEDADGLFDEVDRDVRRIGAVGGDYRFVVGREGADVGNVDGLAGGQGGEAAGGVESLQETLGAVEFFSQAVGEGFVARMRLRRALAFQSVGMGPPTWAASSSVMPYVVMAWSGSTCRELKMRR